MRSKQVQILSGICGVQLIGYACRAAGFKTDIWIGFAWAAGVIFRQSCFMSVLQDHLLQRLLYTLDHFGGMRI